MLSLEIMNSYRKDNGFYTINELIHVVCLDNTIIDVYSVLISRDAVIGKNNIFYPNVIISSDSVSTIQIGDVNVFSSCVQLISENGGTIQVGHHNFFDVGGISIKCNRANTKVKVGNFGRYDGRINVFGDCDFGSGSQIIGSINVYNCILEEGGDFKEVDPNKRAGLIKGFGTAKNLVVKKGMVINGMGDFMQSSNELQANYHK